MEKQGARAFGLNCLRALFGESHPPANVPGVGDLSGQLGQHCLGLDLAQELDGRALCPQAGRDQAKVDQLALLPAERAARIGTETTVVAETARPTGRCEMMRGFECPLKIIPSILASILAGRIEGR